MSNLYEESLFNTTIVFAHSILSGFSNVVLYALGVTSNVSEHWIDISSLFSLTWRWQAFFSFDEFQVALLKVFLFILTFNLISICIAWKVYGKNIYDTFMKPVTPKIIEDLKKSVSRLNLPKEHSPRV